MANESLIRGAAMAAPKFNPAAESFQKGFASSFEGISKSYTEEAEKLKALEEKRAKDAEKLYADKPLVQDGEIPNKFRPVFTEASMRLKNEYADLIKNKDSMDPLAFIDKQNEYKSKVGDLNKQINALATWQAGVIEAHGEGGSDNLSQSMTAEEQERVQDILDGNYKMENRDGKVGFVDPKTNEFYSLDNLPQPRIKATVANNELEKQAMQLGAFAGKGYAPTSETFKNSLKTLKNKIESYSKDEILSLYSDYSGLAGPNGVKAPSNPTDQELSVLKEQLYDFYKAPAETMAKEAYAEYQRRTAPKANTGNNFTAGLRQQLQTRYGEAAKYASIANTLKGQKEGGSIESKMKFILKEMKAMNPDIDLITRGDAYNSFYQNRKAEWDKATKSERKENGYLNPYDEENKKAFRKAFKDKYGDAQFFNSKDLTPRNDVDTTDSVSLFNFMLGQANMTDEAKAVFRDQFMPGLVGEKRKEEKTKGQGFNYQPGSNMDPTNVNIGSLNYRNVTI